MKLGVVITVGVHNIFLDLVTLVTVAPCDQGVSAVDRDAMQPCTKSCFASKIDEASVCAKIRVLDDIEGVVVVSGEARR
jgi:hypothetical protein